jgi:hypothetical protein
MISIVEVVVVVVIKMMMKVINMVHLLKKCLNQKNN